MTLAMSSRLLAGAVALLLVLGTSGAVALELDPDALLAADPPPGAISDNLEFVANAPEASSAIAVNFIDDTMFVSTVTGIYSYDVADPAAPQLLGVLPMYIWENEDMDLDAERELLFISRDPRGFTTPVAPAQARLFGAVHIIDVSNPALMAQIGFVTLPAGHTSTCVSADPDDVDSCDYLWTGGPYGNTAFGPYGRPIYATDVTDPLNPVTCPEPINTGLMDDGSTGYAHDVQVDGDGVAWVSHEAGVNGDWTAGDHTDPLTGVVRTATPCDPVPYGGGSTPADATPSRFMHNSYRNVDLAIPGEPGSAGAVLMATEENLSSSCASSGRFATYDIRSSLDGSGFADPAGFRMDVLDTWTPEAAEGATGCASAHYFEDRGDGLLAYAFYGQGLRLLDVSDPGDIRQVGYFRPDDASAWAGYWHDGYLYVADNGRGVDILRLDETPDDSASTDPGAMPTLTAPALSAAAAARQVARFEADEVFGYLCAIVVA